VSCLHASSTSAAAASSANGTTGEVSARRSGGAATAGRTAQTDQGQMVLETPRSVKLYPSEQR
jgi:hypothetical protein